MKCLVDPFCHLRDATPLNGAMLGALYRGDRRLLDYTDKWYFKTNRPSTRPGESSGDFYPVPRTMKEVAMWRDFFKDRRVSVDARQLKDHHIGKIVLMSKTLAVDTLNGYRDKFSEHQRGVIPKKIDAKALKEVLIAMVIGARRRLLSLKVNLNTAFREIFPPPMDGKLSPVADPPAEVSLEDWPILDDRGDGKRGSPVDHELISFPAEILVELTMSEDIELKLQADSDAGYDSPTPADGSTALTPSSRTSSKYDMFTPQR